MSCMYHRSCILTDMLLAFITNIGGHSFTCTRGYLGLEFVIPLHHISRPGHHLVPQLQCA